MTGKAIILILSISLFIPFLFICPDWWRKGKLIKERILYLPLIPIIWTPIIYNLKNEEEGRLPQKQTDKQFISWPSLFTSPSQKRGQAFFSPTPRSPLGLRRYNSEKRHKKRKKRNRKESDKRETEGMVCTKVPDGEWKEQEGWKRGTSRPITSSLIFILQSLSYVGIFGS